MFFLWSHFPFVAGSPCRYAVVFIVTMYQRLYTECPQNSEHLHKSQKTLLVAKTTIRCARDKATTAAKDQILRHPGMVSKVLHSSQGISQLSPIPTSAVRNLTVVCFFSLICWPIYQNSNVGSCLQILKNCFGKSETTNPLLHMMSHPVFVHYWRHPPFWDNTPEYFNPATRFAMSVSRSAFQSLDVFKVLIYVNIC